MNHSYAHPPEPFKMDDMSDQIPRRNFLPGRLLGRTILSLFGWQIEGDLPQLSKAIICVAPHTSNWDFVFGMAGALSRDLDASWFGKHSLFRFRPVARILTWLGGIPVDRNLPHGIIEQVIQTCNSRKSFLFGLAPEGTRRRVTRWKTGIYHISRNTNVPIIPVCNNYPRRRIVVYESFQPDQDMEHAMLEISRYYCAYQAKKPANFSPHIADRSEPSSP